MERDKRQIVIMYVDQMDLPASYKNLVLRAVNEKDPSKECEKVVDGAYKYALLIETKVLSSKRETRALVHLKTACESYGEELSSTNER